MIIKRFQNKVCFVTGAGSGIGKATALSFAREGGKVMVCDINENNAQTTANEIVASGGEAIALVVNIANRADVENSIIQTVKHFGRLDVALNCAGIAGPLSAK